MPWLYLARMDGVAFFDEALNPQLARALLLDAKRRLADGQANWRTNASWRPAIVRASSTVLVHDLDAARSKIIVEGLVEKGVIDAATGWSVMSYAWTRQSYIPWHNDENHTEAVTVYLNEAWDPNWGGLFLWRESKHGAIHGREPKFNTAVRNSSKLFHATTPVTMDAAEPRFTLQLFRDE